jgi:STE24 endopeptidase
LGRGAWLYCWTAAGLFTLAIQYIAPVWILPMFNKFTPLQEGGLRNAIYDYAKSVRFQFRDIFVVDGSRRSTKPNAFFTGFGQNKRIALFDTLVAEHTIPEVVAVLAHEVGHYKKRHFLIMTFLGFAHMGILFFLLSVFIGNRALFDAFYMKHVSVYGGLVFFGLLYEPVSFVLSLLWNVFSRRHELQADRFSVETTDAPEHMASALKKLSVKTLTNLTPHPFYVFLNYSHPPLLRRLETIQESVTNP